MRAAKGAVHACVFGILGLCGGLGAAVVPVAVAELRDQPAPGTPPGTTFNSSFAQYMGSGSTVGFSATIKGPGITVENETGLWIGQAGGTPSLVARQGAQAAGVPAGVNYLFIHQFPRVSGNALTFWGTLQGPGVNDDNRNVGYYADGNSTQLVYRQGGPAPGLPGVQLRSPGGPTLNASGQVAWYSMLSGSGVIAGQNDRAIFVGPVAAPQVVLRSGTVAPGTGGKSFLDMSTPTMNNAGHISFTGELTGSGVTDANDEVAYAGAPDSLVLLAREGAQAPGLPAGTTVAGFDSAPVLGHSGRAAFLGQVAGSGVSFSNDRVLWAGAVGDPKVILRTGSPAPGMPAGMNVTSFQGFKQTDAGKLVVRAATANSLGQVGLGLWHGDETGLGLLAAEGTQMNGESLPVIGVGDFDANELGQIVWSEVLSDFSSVIFLRDSSGVTRRLLGAGDQLDLGGGDLRTIAGAGFGYSGTPILDGWDPLNDQGLLTFRATFTDGSNGTFVVNVVPEPSAGWAVVAAGLWWRSRRSREFRRRPSEA